MVANSERNVLRTPAGKSYTETTIIIPRVTQVKTSGWVTYLIRRSSASVWVFEATFIMLREIMN